MSKIIISNEAIESIISEAALSVEGVAGTWKGIREFTPLCKEEQRSPHGIEFTFSNGFISIKIYLIAKYGYSLKEIGISVQKTIKEQIENLTPFKTSEVNVFFVDVENEA